MADYKYLLIGIFILLFLLSLVIPKDRKQRKKRNSYPYYKNENAQFSVNINNEFLDKKQNERIKSILNSDFKAVPLMNKSEFKLFKIIQNLLNEKHKEQGYRLFSQVGLGGFIQLKTEFKNSSKEMQEAFWSINHLRADFLIIDLYGKPILVIEYQGNGHRISNSTDRDTRKRYACNKVGIELIEFFDDSDKNNIEKISLFLNNHYSKIRN